MDSRFNESAPLFIPGSSIFKNKLVDDGVDIVVAPRLSYPEFEEISPVLGLHIAGTQLDH